MYTATAPLPRSVWADLDALVLEEVEALRIEEAPPPPRFESDEDFLVRTLAYLAEHPDPSALVERLRKGFGPPEDSAEDAAEEAAPDPTVAAAPEAGEPAATAAAEPAGDRDETGAERPDQVTEDRQP